MKMLFSMSSKAKQVEIVEKVQFPHIVERMYTCFVAQAQLLPSFLICRRVLKIERLPKN